MNVKLIWSDALPAALVMLRFLLTFSQAHLRRHTSQTPSLSALPAQWCHYYYYRVCACACARAPTSLSFLRWSLCSLLSHLSVRIQRVLETLSERTFADVALAFFLLYIIFFCEEDKKKTRSLTVHVECALESLVSRSARPGKRPPQWIIPFF